MSHCVARFNIAILLSQNRFRIFLLRAPTHDTQLQLARVRSGHCARAFQKLPENAKHSPAKQMDSSLSLFFLWDQAAPSVPVYV